MDVKMVDVLSSALRTVEGDGPYGVRCMRTPARGVPTGAVHEDTREGRPYGCGEKSPPVLAGSDISTSSPSSPLGKGGLVRPYGGGG